MRQSAIRSPRPAVVGFHNRIGGHGFVRCRAGTLDALWRHAVTRHGAALRKGKGRARERGMWGAEIAAESARRGHVT
jgi:hypothetical protein